MTVMLRNVFCLTVNILVSFLIVDGHLVGDKAHLTELKKLCEHAYTCFHDTVIICGKSVNEARTFLDLCDLYEYSCEYNMVFRHVKEEEGVCPNPKEVARRAAGIVATDAEIRKCQKYGDIIKDYIFLAFGMETMGPWGLNAKLFLSIYGTVGMKC